MDRLKLLENWLKMELPEKPFSLSPASSDASFRRYFRASFEDGSLIAMDAPPNLEDCRPFIHVAQLFEKSGAHLPKILAQDLNQGFLLLSDLGSTTYLEVLDESNADALYGDAIDSLIRIQLLSKPGVLPDYDEHMLMREMRLFPQWYLSAHLSSEPDKPQSEILEAVFSRLLKNNLAQPKVYVHRDFHSRNLMVSHPNPGILDFQDAVYGPITYDLASLFKDAYIRWEEERILDWVIRYWEKAKKASLPVSYDFAEFYRDFEWMGAQRHIKVAGIFSRLCHRDGKERYLADIPLVLSYLSKTCARYPELSPMLRFIEKIEARTTF